MSLQRRMPRDAPAIGATVSSLARNIMLAKSLRDRLEGRWQIRDRPTREVPRQDDEVQIVEVIQSDVADSVVRHDLECGEVVRR